MTDFEGTVKASSKVQILRMAGIFGNGSAVSCELTKYVKFDISTHSVFKLSADRSLANYVTTNS